MEQDNAIRASSALAQTLRMSIFRLLVRVGPAGLPMGGISRRLNIVTSALSGHLSVFKQAGLLRATRHGKEIYDAANLTTVKNLVRFLLADCCGGRLENCSEIMSLLEPKP